MALYIGVDYHQKYSFVTVMNEAGNIVQERRLENSREALANFLAIAPRHEPCAAVLEATRNWTVMHDWLEEVVDEVHLAHPMKAKAIAAFLNDSKQCAPETPDRLLEGCRHTIRFPSQGVMVG